MSGLPLGAQPIDAHHGIDPQTKAPNGGVTVAPGLRVTWDDTGREGATLETGLQVVINRARFLQHETSEQCDEYEAALVKLEDAQGYLTRRQQQRLAANAGPSIGPQGSQR